MNTVTEQSPADTPAVEDNGASHLDAAKEFFSSDAEAPAAAEGEQKSTEQKPAETKPAEKFNPLAEVVKLPGQKDAAKTDAQAPADTPPEDIAKGLIEPRADSKSHAGWQELKKKGNEAIARAAAAEKELAAIKAQQKSNPPAADEATKARISELETQVKAYSERLKVLDLKSHPEFEEKFVRPQQAAKATLANIAKSDEVEVNLDELLSLKGKAFNQKVSETMEQLTPYARVKFQAALDTYLNASVGAEEALAKADEFLQAAKQTGGARSRAAFDQAAGTFESAFVPLAVDEKADEAAKQEVAQYNAAVANIRKQAEAYAFGQLDERGVAEIAHKAALYDFSLSHGLPLIGKKFEAHVAKREAYIAELESQVKAMKASSPSLDSGSGAPPAEGSAEQESHLEAARRYKWS